eukprot:scaffold9764_cov23-Tisochrysis_lutea.AAC.1
MASLHRHKCEVACMHSCRCETHARTQAIWQDARRKAAWASQPWIPALADILPIEVFGPYKQPWPQ